MLRVAGFKNEAPIFKFVRRQNVALSIDSDKTDETELHAAVSGAVQHLAPFATSLVKYTSYADAANHPGPLRAILGAARGQHGRAGVLVRAGAVHPRSREGEALRAGLQAGAGALLHPRSREGSWSAASACERKINTEGFLGI